MSFKPFKLEQIELVSAISNEITRQNPGMPFESTLFNKIVEAANSIVDECKRERVYANVKMTPEQWLESDDVGQSSRYMLTVLASLGYPMPDGETPSDANDLGRCIRMVKSCGLETEIPKLYEMGPAWLRIAQNWTELNNLYDNSNYKEIYTFLNQQGI